MTTTQDTTTRQDEATIKAAVKEHYGARAQAQLDAETKGDFIPLVDASAAAGASASACCGPEASDDGCGCGVEATSEDQITAVKAFYEGTDTSDLPETVTDVSLGCGNPTAIAELKTGETVLDLGSGGGIDCFIAAKAVGPEGHVIGVDMTDQMLDLAAKNAAKVGVTNVEFRKGEIEHLPVADNTVDVIISNCVINLSSDKSQVLDEAFRVLKPGGRFRVSDIVLTRELSFDEEKYLAEWAGCIAGALQQSDFASRLEASGFEDVSLELQSEWRDAVHSAVITAVKPA
jgi:arsenite methyltransferase